TGRRTSSPPQLGQRQPGRRLATQSAQKVHSNVQIMASAASGARSLSQHSQLGLSFSIVVPRVDTAAAERSMVARGNANNAARRTPMDFPELVQRFAAAAASGNGDALADLFTPNGTYDDYFFGPSTGRDAIKKMLAHFADGGANFRWEFFDPALTGSTGYASYRFSFDSKRPEANGARVAFDGIGRFDLDAS